MTLAALALAVAANGPAAANGAARVHPKLRVTAAKVSGKALRFAVTITFSPPKGTGGAAACRGKVKLSEKVKRGKAPHWSGKLAATAGLCRAVIKGRLPASLLGRKVAFKLTFAGNGKVAAFARAAKLKLSPPHPSGGGGGAPGSEPPGPPVEEPEGPVIPSAPWLASDGGWEGHNNGIPYYLHINFTVKDGVIKAPFAADNAMLLTCHKKDGINEEFGRYQLWSFHNTVPLHSGGNFDETWSYAGGLSVTTEGELHYRVHGQLGETEGTMVVEITDARYEEEGGLHTQEQCAGATTTTVKKVAPAF